MKGVEWSTLSPEKQEAMRGYCLQDSKLCYQLAEKYLPTWPLEEQEISILNREIGMYGVQLDEEYVDKSIKKLHQIKFDAEKKLPWRDSSDADTAVLSPKAVAKLCGELNIPMPTRLDADGVEKTTLAQNEPQVVAWEAEYGKRYPWVGSNAGLPQSQYPSQETADHAETQCRRYPVFQLEVFRCPHRTVQWRRWNEHAESPRAQGILCVLATCFHGTTGQGTLHH